MKYFDAHCHVQFPIYDEDRTDVIARMKTEGVGGLIVGCDFESSVRAVELAHGQEHLWASIGLHPNHEADEWYETERYLELGKNPKVVAVGECGLDYYRAQQGFGNGPAFINPKQATGASSAYYRPAETTEEVKHKQKRLFQDHIKLAIALDKPLIIHARPTKGSMDAYHDALDLLEAAKTKHPNLRGDFHFFVGNIATAARVVALDFTISYTAVLTFARDYDEVVRSIPLSHLLSETDAPYAAPVSRRGERNDPLAIPEVVAKIAEIRNENLETVRTALLNNAQKLFKI